MIRRVLALAAAAVVSVALPASAHYQSNFGNGFVEWQGWRTASVYSGPTYHGAASIRTFWNPYWNEYGFDMSWISDWTQNGGGDCVQVWVDFKRSQGAGQHRNPTTIRHCNTNGNVYGYHGGLTDVVANFPQYIGWDITICRAIQQPGGRWKQFDCTNEVGHKPMHWIESSEPFNGGGNPRTGRFDWEISDGNCIPTVHDYSYRLPGCVAYLHVV